MGVSRIKQDISPVSLESSKLCLDLKHWFSFVFEPYLISFSIPFLADFIYLLVHSILNCLSCRRVYSPGSWQTHLDFSEASQNQCVRNWPHYPPPAKSASLQYPLSENGQSWKACSVKKHEIWDVPGGPVVKDLPCSATDAGLIPGLGRFHMQSN